MADPIRLIVGLGNPGPQYEVTRHNAGFWLLDHIADDMHCSFDLESGFFGKLAKTRFQGQQIYLLKPLTYMNLSGKSVVAVANFFKIETTSILIVHDELDLMPGQIKLKKGGGHAGHNGLKSIQSVFGQTDFWRLRIGIGHPRTLNLAQGVADFVLHQPSQEQLSLIEDSLLKGRRIIPSLLEGDMDKANRLLAKKV